MTKSLRRRKIAGQGTIEEISLWAFHKNCNRRRRRDVLRQSVPQPGSGDRINSIATSFLTWSFPVQSVWIFVERVSYVGRSRNVTKSQMARQTNDYHPSFEASRHFRSCQFLLIIMFFNNIMIIMFYETSEDFLLQSFLPRNLPPAQRLRRSHRKSRYLESLADEFV